MESKFVSGVFRYLCNSAAFVDTVSCQIWGDPRKSLETFLTEKGNRAIGGPDRPYARCFDGTNKITGNRFQFRYGKMSPHVNVSPFALVIWSHRSPVTCADVMLTVQGLMCRRAKIKLSRLELTLDTTVFPFQQFEWELCTSARTFREFGTGENRTISIGATNSAWRMKIYQKTSEIVRTEFTFTRRYLGPRKIDAPPDIARLRKADVWECASFQSVDQSQGHELPPKLRDPWLKIGHGLPPDVPACILIDAFREVRIDPSRWVVPSATQHLLRSMSRNLVW